MAQRVRVYIDGFNFYYGLYRGRIRCDAKLKWLNPIKLGHVMCRVYGISVSSLSVHYFSAPSLPGQNDPGQPTRQQHFLAALGGIPGVEITLGQHMERKKKVRLLGSPAIVDAMVREEKGSDVNLATFLVRDAAKNYFDVALVVSNDSDLENAIKVAIDDFNKTVIVVSPQINGPVTAKGKTHRPRVTAKLKAVATRAHVLDHTLLANCRLPDPAPDEKGRLVSCPKEWT